MTDKSYVEVLSSIGERMKCWVTFRSMESQSSSGSPIPTDLRADCLDVETSENLALPLEK